MVKNRKFIRMIKKNFKIICISAAAGFFISYLVFSNLFFAIVDGHSMDNTLHDTDILVIYLNSYKDDSPKYMDIVNIYAPDVYDNYIVKRIIGLPGDKLEIKDNTLYVNGVIVDEPYIKEKMDKKYQNVNIEIPKDKYFVMGDNRNISYDSRNFGLIDLDEIQGKVMFKYCKPESKIIQLYKFNKDT